MKNFDDAIKSAEYFSRMASARILNHIEEIYGITPETRKVVLDAVNDMKRELVREFYGSES